MSPMTEPIPPSRQAPKRRPATVADLTMLVRVPGRPDMIRAFTATEHDEAAQYAAQHNGSIDDLPS